MKLTNLLQRLMLSTSNSTPRATKRRRAMPPPGKYLESLESRVVLTASLASQAEELLSQNQSAVAAQVAAAVPSPQDLAPYVVSITPNFTAPLPVATTSVNYTVTFSKPVKNITDADFSASMAGNEKPLTVTVTKVSDTVYTLTVNNLAPSKKTFATMALQVQLNDNSNITDLEGRKLVGFAKPSSQMNGPSNFLIPSEVFSGDINGDGAPDLLMKTYLGYQYSLNNGQIVFATPALATGLSSSYRVLALADVTGDGKADVISAQAGGGIFIQAGDGTGKFNVISGAPDSQNAALLGALGDFNNDARQDFAYVVSRPSGASAIRLNVGSSSKTDPFNPALAGDVYTSTKTITEVVPADINGDDKLDLVMRTNAGLEVALGDGTGKFTFASKNESLGTVTDVAVGDLNGDGKLDIAVAGSGSPYVFYGNGTGILTSPQRAQLKNLAGDVYQTSSQSLAIADLNSDGFQDLVLTATSFGSGYGLYGGTSGLGRTFLAVPSAPTSETFISLSDFNKDGMPDAVVVKAGGKGTPVPGYINTVKYAITGYYSTTPIRPYAGADLPPTDIKLSKTAVAENAKVGTVVGKLTATDADKKDTFTYSLVDGDGSTGNSSFAISGANLTTTKTFDFEAQKTYSIRLQVADGFGRIFQKVFTINVIDGSEPLSVPAQSFDVIEQSADGTVVGKVVGGGGKPGQAVQFSITGGNDFNTFAINATTGVITVAKGSSLSQSNVPQYPLTVTATIAGKKPLTASGTVTIKVQPAIGELAVQSITLTTGDPITTAIAKFDVKFTRSIDKVNRDNFTLVTTGGVIAGPITSIITRDRITYTVTVSGIDLELPGTLALKFTDPTNTLVTGDGVKFGDGYAFSSDAYTVVDPTANKPTVVSLDRGTNDPITTESTQFTVTFSEPVTGVSASNFVVVTTGGVIANANVEVNRFSDTQYIVTVTGIDFETAGTLGVNLIDPNGTIKNASNQGLNTALPFVGQTYVVQNPTVNNPTVVSLDRGTSDPITTESTQFTVTFSEPVTGVSASNFVVVKTGGVIANANVEVIRYSDTQYIATVTGIDFETSGTLGVNLVDPNGTIKNAANQSLNTALPFVGQTYNVQVGAATTPILLSILKSDHLPISGATAEFLVTFNEPVTGVTAANFVANAGGGVTTDATVEVTQVSGGSVYWVQVTGITKTGTGGTLKLDFYDFGQTRDSDNNGLPENYSYGGLEYSVQ